MYFFPQVSGVLCLSRQGLERITRDLSDARQQQVQRELEVGPFFGVQSNGRKTRDTFSLFVCVRLLLIIYYRLPNTLGLEVVGPKKPSLKHRTSEVDVVFFMGLNLVRCPAFSTPTPLAGETSCLGWASA